MGFQYPVADNGCGYAVAESPEGCTDIAYEASEQLDEGLHLRMHGAADVEVYYCGALGFFLGNGPGSIRD